MTNLFQTDTRQIIGTAVFDALREMSPEHRTPRAVANVMKEIVADLTEVPFAEQIEVTRSAGDPNVITISVKAIDYL